MTVTFRRGLKLPKPLTARVANTSTQATNKPLPFYKLPVEKVLLYADRGLAVLNKPNGLIAQLADPRNVVTERSVDADIFSTLMNDLRDHLKLQHLLRTIHRLDKPTTGALALACTKQSTQEFSRQLSIGQAQKTYLALVCGDAASFKHKHGIIETRLECRNGWVRIPGVTDVYERDRDGLVSGRLRGENWTRDAVSEYEVVASSSEAPISLLRLQLRTGCKHQLRVHLAQYLRTPILGDSLYMNPRSKILKDIKKILSVPRSLFLHSSQFSLIRYLPAQCRLTIGAPLPPNFVSVCRGAGIKLDLDDETGGVWVDGTKVRGADIVSPEDLGETVEDAVRQLRGRWYGPSLSR